MGTSEGASKGWTEERRARQRETLRRQRNTPEWRAAQAERTRQQWAANPDRRITQGNKVSQARRDEFERFQEFLSPPNEDGCILWTGGTRHGYAIFSYVRRQGEKAVSFSAARWLWKRERGPIADGLTIEHNCHTRDLLCPGGIECRHRLCVNLEHIRLVTAPHNVELRHARELIAGIDSKRNINGQYVRKESP